jgi:predicted RNA-binding protein with PUA-like domain
MATFLLKTEPGDYAWDDLVRDKETVWDGVSNAAARSYIRTIRKGDDALIYHTGDERRIVGLARVVTGPYEDPDEPGQNSRGEIAAPVFDLKPVRRAPTPVRLAQIKADERFAEFALVRQGRLSVMEVPPAMDRPLRKMCGL